MPSPTVSVFKVSRREIASLECDGSLASGVDGRGGSCPVLGVGLDPVVAQNEQHGHTTKVVGELIEGVVGDHFGRLPCRNGWMIEEKGYTTDLLLQIRTS